LLRQQLIVLRRSVVKPRTEDGDLGPGLLRCSLWERGQSIRASANGSREDQTKGQPPTPMAKLWRGPSWEGFITTTGGRRSVQKAARITGVASTGVAPGAETALRATVRSSSHIGYLLYLASRNASDFASDE
jgi:hypothetical protein